MSTFAPYEPQMQLRSPAPAFGSEAPLSEHQEMALATEALEILAEYEFEEFLGNVLRGVAAGAGRALHPAVAGQLGAVLRGVATATLPAASKRRPAAPRPGEAVGRTLGSMIERLLQRELEGLDRKDAELERARRYVALAAEAARHAALAPHGAPPRGVVGSALARALTEHAPGLLELEFEEEAFPSMRAQALLAVLLRKPLSYKIVRQNGSHRRLEADGRPAITFAYHNRATVGPVAVKKVLVNDVGLSVEDALRLL
jgi:predicted RNA binding protein YcfA (HicA-like mRNA interferase family)